jgi:hypothetical protein
VNVVTPKKLTPEQRELFAQLADSLESEQPRVEEEKSFFSRVKDALRRRWRNASRWNGVEIALHPFRFLLEPHTPGSFDRLPGSAGDPHLPDPFRCGKNVSPCVGTATF